MLAHQIPVILGGASNPSVIFFEMPGAWLEPRIGSIWQENTGVTPTTSGGQTIGKLIDLSAGRVASQAIAANRPLLGARWNLLTNTDGAKFGSLLNLVETSSGVLDYAGNPTARIVRNDSVNGFHRVFATVGASGRYTFSQYIKNVDANFVRLHMTGTVNVNFGANFNVAAGAVASTVTSGSAPVASIEYKGDGWYRVSLTAPADETSAGNVQLHIIENDYVSGANIPSYAGTGKSLIFGGADLRLTANVGKEPEYQRVTTATDYDAGRFLAVHCDSNDFMTVSLPDLGGGVFSSSGSVYFALNTGMSALHNQSIGTSYSAPIQSMDLYGAVIVPSRLSDQREQQLQTYFEKLAGLR